MIKVLLTDVDDTLLDFKACSEESLCEALRLYGYTLTDGIRSAFFSVTSSLWAEVEAGKLTREALFGVRFEKVFARLGMPIDGKEFEKCFHTRLYDSHIAFPGAKEALSGLSRRIKIYAASNAPRDQQENRLKKAGLYEYLDGIFASDEIGFSKPQSGFFEHCLDRLFPLEPGEIMMLGDSPEADIAGAARLGLVTCLFDPDGHGATGIVPPDFVIHSLAELKRII